MHTSAQALSEAQTFLSQKKPGSERVAVALASIFGLEGFDAEGAAMIQLRRLTLKLKDDVDQYGGDPDGKKLLKQNLSAFNGILNFSQLHFTIEEAKKHWLKSDNLVALTYIGMALRGQIEYEDARESCENLSETIKDLRAKIAESDMEKHVKEVLDKRL